MGSQRIHLGCLLRGEQRPKGLRLPPWSHDCYFFGGLCDLPSPCRWCEKRPPWRFPTPNTLSSIWHHTPASPRGFCRPRGFINSLLGVLCGFTREIFWSCSRLGVLLGFTCSGSGSYSQLGVLLGFTLWEIFQSCSRLGVLLGFTFSGSISGVFNRHQSSSITFAGFGIGSLLGSMIGPFSTLSRLGLRPPPPYIHCVRFGLVTYSPTNLTQATGGIGSSRLSARSQSQNRFGGSPQTHGLGSHLSRSSALPFLRQNGYAQRSLCVSSLQQGPCQPVVLVTTC